MGPDRREEGCGAERLIIFCHCELARAGKAIPGVMRTCLLVTRRTAVRNGGATIKKYTPFVRGLGSSWFNATVAANGTTGLTHHGRAIPICRSCPLAGVVVGVA